MKFVSSEILQILLSSDILGKATIILRTRVCVSLFEPFASHPVEKTIQCIFYEFFSREKTAFSACDLLYNATF